jgi:hypothetical protein
MEQTNRRWDTDDRGTGASDARTLVPDAERLLEAMARPGWVAEDPDAHLLPHLRRACEAGGSPWSLLEDRIDDDGGYLVTVEHRGSDAWNAFRDGIALLAAVAESSFHVRRRDPQTLECVTGMLDGDGEFASHGHVIRLRIHLAGTGTDG